MQDAYRHEAVPYSGRDEFVSSCVALAEDGRAQGERLIFLVASAKLGDLRDALSGGADDIEFVATDEHGRNPARITTLLDGFRASSHGRRCLGVNESVFAGRSRAAVAEAQLAESVLNSVSLRSWPLSVACLYDAQELDADSLAEMRRGHRVVRGEQDNESYDPERAGALFTAPLNERPDDVEARDVSKNELATTREFVRGYAREEDLPSDRVEDLVLAANEIVTNSLQHGGGECRIAVWADDESVICEVRDAGLILDPLVGRLTPSVTAPAGRGLWLTNHLCDLVQVRSSQAGTVVRLHVNR